MADPFTSLIATLNAMGFYGFILPWIFVFAVIYGLLIASKVFGEGGTARSVSAAIAFVAAFFVTVLGGPTLATFFVNLFGGASLIIAGILVIVLFFAMTGLSKEQLFEKKGGTKAVAIIVVVIGIVLFLVSSGALAGAGIGVALSEQAAAAIFIIIVLILAVWLITREGEKPAATK